MDQERQGELFWLAHAMVRKAARLRYDEWQPDYSRQDLGFYGQQWEWAMTDPDFSFAIMTLILEGK